MAIETPQADSGEQSVHGAEFPLGILGNVFKDAFVSHEQIDHQEFVDLVFDSGADIDARPFIVAVGPARRSPTGLDKADVTHDVGAKALIIKAIAQAGLDFDDFQSSRCAVEAGFAPSLR